MNLSKLKIKSRIIRKLVRWQKWGGAHTENISNGLPRHLRVDKAVKEALKEFEKDEWLLSTNKTGEVHYWLNRKKTGEILQFYEKYCKNFNE